MAGRAGILGYPEHEGGGGDANSDAFYVLAFANTTDFPNSYIIEAGNNVSLDISSGVITINAAATGGGAPTSATYVTISTEPSLTNERRLAEGTFIDIVDNGANSTVEIAMDASFLQIPFVTLGAVTGLTAERTLQVQDGLVSSDGGANSTFSISASPLTLPQYLVLSANSTLANERVFTPGANLTPTDGGAGGTYTLDVTGVAQSNETYLVLNNTSGLSNERQLRVGTGLSMTDGGANGTLTLAATGGSSFGVITSTGETPVSAYDRSASLAVEPGTGIDIVLSPGTITVINTQPNTDQNMFGVIAAPGWGNITPDSTNDTLTITGTNGLSVGTIPGTDTLVFSASDITAAFLDAAPDIAQYLTLATSGALDNERVFTPSRGLSASDGGAGGAYTLNNISSSLHIVKVQGQSDIVAYQLHDQFGFIPGTGITMSVSGSDITITNSSPNANQDLFYNHAVSGWGTIVPDGPTDTLTYEGTDWISIGTKSGSDTLVFSASTLTAAGLDAAPDTAQYLTLATSSALDNERVLTPIRGLQAIDNGAGSTYILNNTASSFHLVKVQGQSDIVAYELQDQFGFIPGTGISLTVSGSSITITNSSPNSSQNLFDSIAVDSEETVTANSPTTQLTFVASTGMEIHTDNSSKTITFMSTASGGGGGTDQNLWDKIAAPGWPNAVADNTSDTLNFEATDGLSVGITPGTDTITWSASSITAAYLNAAPDTPQYLTLATDSALDNERVLTPSRGLSAVDGGAGSTYTLSNISSAFHLIKVQGQSDVEAYLLHDQVGFIPGTGISMSVSGSSITITNSSPNSDQDLFYNHAVSGWPTVTPDNSTDTLTYEGTDWISIGTKPGSDTLVFSASTLTAAGLDAAPDTAQYLTLATSAALDNERVFTPSRGLSATDGGANGTYTLNNTSSAFHFVKVQGQNDIEAYLLHDQFGFAPGTGISLSVSGSTITITNSSPNSNQNLYNTYAAPGWASISPDSPTDTLNLIGAGGISVGLSTDTIHISASDITAASLDAAPDTAQYLTLATSAALDNERVLTPSRGLSATDGGAGSTYTLNNISSSIHVIKVAGQTDVEAFLLHDQVGFVNGTGIAITTAGSSITFTNTQPNADQNVFTTYAVTGQSSCSPDSTTDTLTFNPLNGIVMSVDSSTDTISISGSGITTTSLGAAPNTPQFLTLATDSGLSNERVFTPSTGLSAVDGGANGNYTLSNSASSFGRIKVSGQNDVVAYRLQDQFGLTAGTNVTITTSGSDITINSSAGGSQNIFQNVSNGVATATADSTTDTLTVVGSGGIVVSVDSATDTLIISASALGTPTYNSFPTSGYVQKGFYCHSGAWTSTGALNLESGIKVLFTGNMTLNHTLTVHASAAGGGSFGSIGAQTVPADGGGPGGGSGAKFYVGGGGGGAGAGGAGGRGAGDTSGDHARGGPAYDPYLFFGGSGGGGGSSDSGSSTTGGAGANGGGGLWIECLGAVTINENLTANGGTGSTGGTNTGGGGGGGGGAVSVKALSSITVASSKKIQATGGAGGTETGTGEPGGGGGGGYIELWSPSITISGSLDITAGAVGAGGSGTQTGQNGTDGIAIQRTSTPIFELTQGGYIAGSGTGVSAPSTLTLTANATGTYNTIYILNPVSGSFTFTMPTAVGHGGEMIMVKMASSTGGNTATIGFQFGQTADWVNTSITSSTPYDGWRFYADGTTTTNWIIL